MNMSQPVLWQRIEGLATLVVAIFLYVVVGGSWWLFALLLFAPDLSMLGYGLGNRGGQWIYNVAHTYAIPLVLAALGFALGIAWLLAVSLIWLAHIGMDRAIGYGLKEADGFKYTHLGFLGKPTVAAQL
jgi:hypothetical protein